jgi:restriction system protein
LIDGVTLLGMIRAAQASEGTTPAHRPRIELDVGKSEPRKLSAPDCPRCGASMIERRNRQRGSVFWGCLAYPRCKGTRR